MSKFLRWSMRLVVLCALLGLLAVTPWFLQREAFFRIESTEIALLEGEKVPEWLSTEWAMAVDDVRKFEGKDLWSLEMDEVMTKMKAKGWVRDVQVTRSWPKKLFVHIQPKSLVAYMRGTKGALHPVLEDGESLDSDQLDVFQNLPLLSGDFSRKDKKLINQAIALVHGLPKDGALSLDRISEIGYHDKEGFWFLVMPFGTKVRLGVGEVDRKIARVRQVMEYLDSRQIGARVIDADLSKKVVVRLRKSP